jgi:sugar lactone lactonase YvrE
MDPSIRIVANLACPIGEGPLWHASERRLYWVDIATGRMFRYDPKTGASETFYRGETVGGFTFQADGSLLLFMAHGTIKSWKDGHTETLVDPFQKEPGSRFNDVIADPAGRVYCGTMPTEKNPSRLFMLDTDATLTEVFSEKGMIPNGLAFTVDRKGLYFVDSKTGSIYLFDYEKTDGTLSNRRTFVRIPRAEGLPDGLTVDRENGVWVALCRGWHVVRYTVDGKLDRRIRFPVSKVTSLTFAGRDYTDIYVTSGGDPRREGAGSGALFHMNLGIKGFPEFKSRVLQ